MLWVIKMNRKSILIFALSVSLITLLHEIIYLDVVWTKVPGWGTWILTPDSKTHLSAIAILTLFSAVLIYKIAQHNKHKA
jgi:hypothetical protein